MGGIPRLFHLLPGSPTPTPGAEPIADGVMWADDGITIRWRGHTSTESWLSFADAAVDLTDVTVVWLRQDTYVTQGETP